MMMMKQTRIPEGMVIDIQVVGMTINEDLQKRIFSMIGKFRQYFGKISFVDFHIRQSPKQATAPRTVNVRLGIPGQDVFASDSGKNWKALLTRVEQKIVQQLKKRKTG
jgi:putative sigma-54 modulation protein